MPRRDFAFWAKSLGGGGGGGGGGIRDIGLFFHCASYIEILSTFQVKRVLKFSRKTIAHLLKFRTKAPQIYGFPREFVTLSVA